MGANVINSTVVHNSDMLGVMPDDWQDKVNAILDNAYTYGREGISKMVMCTMHITVNLLGLFCKTLQFAQVLFYPECIQCTIYIEAVVRRSVG
jgi:hypothetical protein